MDSSISFLRTNPMFGVMLGLVLALTLILGLVCLAMMRSGASLRPIIFLAGFFGIVVGPQLLFHASQAFGWIPRRDLTWTFGASAAGADDSRGASALAGLRVRREQLTIRDRKFAQPELVFGEGFDAELITDLRERMPDPFREAHVASMAITAEGGSVVVAHFADEDASERATEEYLRLMTGSVPPLHADGTRTVARASDIVKVLVRDATMIAWSGADSVAVERAFAAAPLLERVAAGSGAGERAPEFWLYRPFTLAALVIVLVLIAAMWFLRMSAWASEVPAAAQITPVEPSELRARLLSINTTDAPFLVDEVPGSAGRLQVTWRYADAKWLDLARLRGIRRTHRILLDFDTTAAVVRAVEQQARLDWSAGAGGADLSWSTERGIVFFQREWGTVYGLQLDATGRFTSNLAYRYEFNLQEMKSPLIRAVTQAGWRWRPSLVRGPSWLRWFTGG